MIARIVQRRAAIQNCCRCPVQQNFWLDPPVVRRANVRSHQRQRPSEVGFWVFSSAGVGNPLRFLVTAATEIDEAANSSANSKLSTIQPVYPHEITGARNCGINFGPPSRLEKRSGVQQHESLNAQSGLKGIGNGVEPMSLMTVQALRTAMLAPALAAAAWNANAQDGDVAAGHTFAREACNSCHVVEPTNVQPRVVVIGSNFQDIANTKGMTATALRVFLTTSAEGQPGDGLRSVLHRVDR